MNEIQLGINVPTQNMMKMKKILVEKESTMNIYEHEHKTNYNNQLFINVNDGWKKLSSSASLQQQQRQNENDHKQQQWPDQNSKSTLFETTTMVIIDRQNNNDKDFNSGMFSFFSFIFVLCM